MPVHPLQDMAAAISRPKKKLASLSPNALNPLYGDSTSPDIPTSGVVGPLVQVRL
ncbi:hypothetical protein F8568_025170 [Actinomadura sp. LD22]|uniref:Uncharacterized protein n=1 Tax=Actinomadura physcomitrii TaxID=2650748 RepID=A0A6I4MN10_9ACTN|nr:hypothetical protein [Actinomadura physcomitrii]MWA03616.1 hypothetical protein [Actinomadura physcomitrii]